MTDLPTAPLSRDILRLTGEDTISLLQSLLTVNLDQLQPGNMAYGALLTPQGKIVDTLILTRMEKEIFIDTMAGRGEPLRKKLALYRLRAKVEIEDVTGTHSIGISKDADEVPGTALVHGPDPRLPAIGWRWLTGEPPAGQDCDDAFRAHLIKLGVPAYGTDYGEAEVFPLDVNLDALHAIDHKKGCFVGQEVASRMFRKGEIRKRTWQIMGDGLTAGDTLMQEGRTVAQVTSAAGMAGLALVRLDRLDGDDDATVTNADGAAFTLRKPDYLS